MTSIRRLLAVALLSLVPVVLAGPLAGNLQPAKVGQITHVVQVADCTISCPLGH